MVRKKKNNITPTVLQRYRHNIKYFKQLKDLLDAHDTFKRSIDATNEARKKQTITNYRLELDRINGELENNQLPLRTIADLKDRKEKLMKAIKNNLNDLDKLK